MYDLAAALSGVCSFIKAKQFDVQVALGIRPLAVGTKNSACQCLAVHVQPMLGCSCSPVHVLLSMMLSCWALGCPSVLSYIFILSY